MRILILATELSPMTGGIQRYTHALALAAAKVAGPANVLVLPFNGTYPVAQSEYMLNDKLARCSPIPIPPCGSRPAWRWGERA